jgi:integrase
MLWVLPQPNWRNEPDWGLLPVPKYKGVVKKGRKYYAYVYYRGRKHYAGRGFQTGERASQARLQLEHELRGGTTIAHTLTFQQYVTMFFEQYAVNWRPRTREITYRKVLNHIAPIIKDRRLRHIKELDIQTIKNAITRQQYSDAYTTELLKLVKLLFRVARDWGLISHNPALNLKMQPRTHKVKTVVTPEQIIGILKRVDGRDRAIIALGFYGGLRRGEVFGLQWTDIDFQTNRIHITRQYAYLTISDQLKTVGSQDTIVMLPTLACYLQDWKAHCTSVWVCPSSQRTHMPMHPHTWLNLYFKPFVRSLGWDISFHDLRHLCAVFLRQQGFDLDFVQRHLRHATITTTVDFYGDIKLHEIAYRFGDLEQYIQGVH